MADFGKIELLFAKLLRLLVEQFSESEVSEVREYISVGEYGLALDLSVAILTKQRYSVGSEIEMLVQDLARAMSLESAEYLQRLRSR